MKSITSWKILKRKRNTDYARSERIEWVKQILENHDHASIKLFYHQESNSKRDIRLYLWAYQHDFVVILQKLGRGCSFLVTSFYLDDGGKRRDYERRFCRYKNKENNGWTKIWLFMWCFDNFYANRRYCRGQTYGRSFSELSRD